MFWARQLVEPVLFADALSRIGTDQKVFIDIGPGSNLTSLIRRSMPAADSVTLTPADADSSTACRAVGELWVRGLSVDFAGLANDGAARPRRRILPTYPYRRIQHLIPRRDPGGSVQPIERNADLGEVPDSAVAAATATADREPELATPLWFPSEMLVAHPAELGRRRGTALVVLPGDPVAAASTRSVVQRAGYHLRTVQLATSPSFGQQHCQARLGVAADISEAWAKMFADYPPDLVVDGSNLGDAADDDGTSAVLHAMSLVRVVAAEAVAGRATPRLVFLTSHAVAVTAAERLDPARAAVLAVVRTAALEYGRTGFGLVDVAGADDSVLAGALGPSTGADPVTAIRGRWQWAMRRARLASSAALATTSGAWRPGFHAVITGGTGALGLEVAEGFANTGLNPRLTLLTRRPASTQVSARVAALESAGAQVSVHQADVCDEPALSRAFDAVGPVDAVLHLAGRAGGALLVNRERQDAVDVLAAKVAGTQKVVRVAEQHGVPNVLLFSSRAGMNGLIGSADYAAANAYMDAFAATRPSSKRTRVVSVGWPTWRGLGMAAGRKRRGRWSTQITPADWIVAEHRLDQTGIVPATALIEMLVDAFRDQVEDAAVELTALAFLAPVVVGAPVAIDIELTQIGEFWRAELSVTGEGLARRQHVRAELRSAPADLGSPDLDLDLDLLTVPVGEATAAEVPVSTRFEFGSRFDVVRKRRQLSAESASVVGLLILDREFDQDLFEHRLHPAILDRALALQVRTVDHIPFSCERLVVHRDLPPAVLVRHTLRQTDDRYLSCDVVLYDDYGRLLVEVEGWTRLPLDATSVAAPGAVRTSAEKTGPPDLTSGITVERGVALTLAMLAGDPPAYVLVIPGEEADALSADHVIPDPSPNPIGAEAPGLTAPVSVLESGHSDVFSQVATAWARSFGLDEVDSDVEFFAMGGDSLTALQLVTQLQAQLELQVGVADLFEAPTVRQLADRLEGRLG